MSADSQPPLILVVNDSPEILDLKREIFEDEGFRVTTRITHETNLEEIVQIAPDLVITDYSSETQTGLLQHLTIDAPLGRVPIVLCTGAVREVEAARSHLDTLGVAIVFKPFEIEHLVHVVRGALGLGSGSEEALPPQAD